MPDFPADILSGPFGSLGPWDCGAMWGGMYSGGWSSSTMQANVAYIAEVFLPFTATLRGFSWANGAAVSGNVDCGLYDANKNQIAHTGSTAQAGASAVQAVGVTVTTLKPGNYYVAVAIDNTTGGLLGQGSASAGWYPWYPAFGAFAMAGAFPLPSALTLAAPGNGQHWIPLFSALLNTSVV